MSDLFMHPADDELLAFGDAELPPAETDRVRAHVDTCPECRGRLDEIQAALAGYVRYHGSELKGGMPAPPRAWIDIRERLAALETKRARRVAMPSLRTWLAAAAVLLICVAVARRFQHAPGVSASQLLRKASAAASAAPARPHRRIQVKTRRGTLVRAVPPGAPSDAYLPALFASAHYSWEDPLSAASFAAWREQLPEKQDQITTEAAFHHIRTSTPHGALAAATLSLRADDLRPVRETLEFRNQEWVEITEAPDEPPAQVAAAPPPRVLPAPGSGLSAPGRELRVLAALRSIGADLGEPVEVARRGSEVVVTGTGLDARKQEQVRASVAAVPGVVLRFEEAPAAPAPPADAAPVRRSPAREPELAARFGEEFTNRVLDASDAVMARAHALRSLAARFPQQIEAGLSAPDEVLLESLRRDHQAALERAVEDLIAQLTPVLPGYTSASGGAPAGHWQARAQRLLAAARDVDRLLNTMLAGSGGESTAELAAALQRLEAEAAP